MLLSVQNLSVEVQTPGSNKRIVEGVSLSVGEQSIVAIVGGSGSGKTTTGLSILQLLPNELKIVEGSILLEDKDLLKYSPEQMQKVRGKDISLVFQEPLNAFNPVFDIGYQIDEAIKQHTELNTKQRQERVWELLDIVGMPEPKRVAQNYPHQLSGGMRQRAMIAQALAVNPKLIIADEPTSNLDVTLQARIIELFTKLKEELKLSILLITHDLGVVQHLTDEVYVMTEGHIVECGRTSEVLQNPGHLYTKQLMDAVKV